MIVGRVIRDEGVGSALRRTADRVVERIEDVRFFSSKDAPFVNIAPGGTGARTGGIAQQLRARLLVERTHRPVLVASSIDRPVHFEGAGASQTLPYIVSVHDLTLLDQRAFLEGATVLIFGSSFLRDQYQLPGEIIEPGLCVAPAPSPAGFPGIAFAGAVQRGKGGHLLPEIARELDQRGKQLHVFGRGDGDLLRVLRAMKNVHVHGYYRGGTLPSLLARHSIGLVLVPSIVPEAFGLTLSEAWGAGAAVAAFDLGAQADRIRHHGGGWVAPLDSGAAGIVQIIDRWQTEPVTIPTNIPTAEDAARAYLALFSILPQDTRYLVPLLPLIAIVVAAALPNKRWLVWLAIAPGILYAAYRLTVIGLPPTDREAYLVRHVPEYRAITRAGTGTIYVCGGEQLKYYARGELLGDFFGPYAYEHVLDHRTDTASIATSLRAIRADYYLVAKRVCAPPRATGGMDLVYEDSAESSA